MNRSNVLGPLHSSQSSAGYANQSWLSPTNQPFQMPPHGNYQQIGQTQEHNFINTSFTEVPLSQLQALSQNTYPQPTVSNQNQNHIGPTQSFTPFSNPVSSYGSNVTGRAGPSRDFSAESIAAPDDSVLTPRPQVGAPKRKAAGSGPKRPTGQPRGKANNPAPTEAKTNNSDAGNSNTNPSTTSETEPRLDWWPIILRFSEVLKAQKKNFQPFQPPMQSKTTPKRPPGIDPPETESSSQASRLTELVAVLRAQGKPQYKTIYEKSFRGHKMVKEVVPGRNSKRTKYTASCKVCDAEVYCYDGYGAFLRHIKHHMDHSQDNVVEKTNAEKQSPLLTEIREKIEGLKRSCDGVLKNQVKLGDLGKMKDDLKLLLGKERDDRVTQMTAQKQDFVEQVTAQKEDLVAQMTTQMASHLSATEERLSKMKGAILAEIRDTVQEADVFRLPKNGKTRDVGVNTMPEWGKSDPTHSPHCSVASTEIPDDTSESEYGTFPSSLVSDQTPAKDYDDPNRKITGLDDY